MDAGIDSPSSLATDRFDVDSGARCGGVRFAKGFSSQRILFGGRAYLWILFLCSL